MAGFPSTVRLAIAIAVTALLAGSSCEGGGLSPRCDATSCPRGCCDSSGTCRSPSSAACGSRGDTCEACAEGLRCRLGACEVAADGGSADGGDHAGAATDAGATDAGGADAGVTDAGATDAGVTDAGVTDAGVTDAGTTVDAGVADAGGPIDVGAPCTSSSQCAGLGASAFCKLQTLPWMGFPPTPYPRGFCSLPCGTRPCPLRTVCAGGESTYPYLFNELERFCTPACTGTCPLPGFQCLPVTPLTIAPPKDGCFMRLGNANPNPPPFTGGGAPLRAGAPCATAADCANPPDPFLAVCLTAAGGFPDGLCLASSDLAPPDSWCALGGGVELGFPLNDGGTSYYCNGSCPNPGLGRVSGRAGYSCFKVSRGDGTVAGTPWPSCASDQDCGEPVPRCDATTGYCCAADGGSCADSL